MASSAHKADTQRAAQLPAPRTIAPSREDVLSNLAFFFGDPVVPERLRDYSEHHAMTCARRPARNPRPAPARPLAVSHASPAPSARAVHFPDAVSRRRTRPAPAPPLALPFPARPHAARPADARACVHGRRAVLWPEHVSAHARHLPAAIPPLVQRHTPPRLPSQEDPRDAQQPDP